VFHIGSTLVIDVDTERWGSWNQIYGVKLKSENTFTSHQKRYRGVCKEVEEFFAYLMRKNFPSFLHIVAAIFTLYMVC
jgi:hypothetical protein